MVKGKGRWFSALLIGAALAATAASAQQVTIAIATGGPGGVYYPLGVGMADVLTKYLPGVVSIARVTGGSIDNLKLVGGRRSEIAFSMADAALDALRGRGKFKAGRLDVRTLMVLYPNRMHVVTIDGKGIETMADLKGKRVSTGSPGSATEIMALRLVEALGFDRDNDMRRERLGAAASADALRDGKIDAFFWVGGLPSPAVTDLGATPGIKIKLIDHDEAVVAMNKRYGDIYTAGVIPAKTYAGQDKSNAIILVQNILVADASLSDRIAYDIVKTLVEKRDALIAVHGEGKSIGLANQSIKNLPIPWHPGALKYFKEKGVAM